MPKFKGLNTFARVLKNKEIKTGCTVHFVDEKLDNGKNIVQKSFFINQNDDENSIKLKHKNLNILPFQRRLLKYLDILILEKTYFIWHCPLSQNHEQSFYLLINRKVF